MPKRLTFVVEQWVLFGPRRLRLITWPCDLDIWPWRSLRLWLTPVVVLHPYTKFEVRRPCRTEDMCILHSLLSYVARANKSQDHSRALQACISPAPRNWRRRPVRPRHTWLKTVEEDLRQFNLGLASGPRRAQNRTAWRTLTGTATSPTSSDWWYSVTGEVFSETF